MKPDNFINIPFTQRNLDRYIVRTSILRVMKNALPDMHGKLLDAGCGKMPYRELVLKNSKVTDYVGLDIETAMEYDQVIKPDYTWDGRVMPFADAAFDCVLATEVMEHCPEPEVFLREVIRVLKPGGTFFFTVPFLWNLHEVPHDEYRYTPFSLQRHLGNSGFTKIEINAMGGWHASLAQMLGLWVRRAPINSVVRRLLSLSLMPVIRILIARDKKHKIVFKEGTMVTGLYGKASKA